MATALHGRRRGRTNCVSPTDARTPGYDACFAMAANCMGFCCDANANREMTAVWLFPQPSFTPIRDFNQLTRLRLIGTA